MNKLKLSLTAIIFAIIAALGIAMPAMADTATPNAATTPIPLSETVNAGDSVNLSDIVYTITVAPKTYSGDSEKGVYTGIAVRGGSPITVKPAVHGRFWEDTVTLEQLFGEAASFPQAGMYEYTVTQTHSGGSSETSKWTYDEPEYLLQVLVKNTTDADGNITGREYSGWTLSKWDPTAKNGDGDYVKVNSGASGQDGAAAFSETYVAKSSLEVTKVVEGAYASTTHGFEQTITLTLPAYEAKAEIGADGGTDGAWSPATIPAEGATTRTYTVKLKHGESVVFTNVPVGTRYQITETTGTDGKAVDAANLKYTPRIDWSVDQSAPADPDLPTGNRSSLAAYSLSELSAIAADISQNPDGDFATEFSSYLGTTMTLDLNAENTDVSSASEDNRKLTVKLVGINHDVDENGNSLGLTFMTTHALPVGHIFKYHDQETYERAGLWSGLLDGDSWANSDLRDALNASDTDEDGYNDNTYYNMFDSELIAYAKVAKKQSNLWETTTSVSTLDQFWIPSVSETGSTALMANPEGTYQATSPEGSVYTGLGSAASMNFRRDGTSLVNDRPDPDDPYYYWGMGNTDDPKGDGVLCGRGFWTRSLANSAPSMIDVSGEVRNYGSEYPKGTCAVVFGFCL